MSYWLLVLLPFCLNAKEIVSIYAVDRVTGKVLIDEQSDVGMTPASCMKVLTTGAALHVLGEKYSFITLLEYDGEINQSILEGNLYIRGGGDPSLGAKDWEGQLQIWAQAIKDLGIHQINGRVMGDASSWETALAAPGWCWDDLGNYYGAGASALSFHENMYELTLQSSEVGGPVAVTSISPPPLDLELRSELVTGNVESGDQTCLYGSEYSSLQFLRGSIPLSDQNIVIKGSISNPSSYVAKLLTQTLQEKGLVVVGENLAEKKRISFHVTKSPSVAEIVFEINQRSMNLYAEHLLKAMGQGSTKEGVQVVKSFWQSAGIDLNDAHITDGSGLSRNNILTAKQGVAVLQKLEQSPHFGTFFRSLPEVNGMRVKSGTMSLVKGYIGYSDDVVFAFFIGQCPDKTKKKALTESCFEKLKKLHSIPTTIQRVDTR